MKKSNLKEIYTYINQTTEKEVDFKSEDLPNNKIKHIIIGNKKVIQPKNQASMTTKQFQEYVIDFIKEQKLVNQRQEETNKKQAEFNQYVIEFIQEQKLVNQRQEETNKKQEKFNEMILQKVDNIDQRLIKVENDIKDIKSCPTIQKELNSK